MYRCGIYLRISKEESENEGESNSIVSQRQIIKQYIDDNKELELCGEWIDDGYSGTNFERPGVRGLLSCAYEGGINCIIVKDLSRFGRNYIETGRYIQYIFPALNIRFISVCDGFDSRESSFMEEALLLPVMNLINDSYCRDISNKVRYQQLAKRKEGIYIGAFAPYGYKKSETVKGRLERDEEAAEVVEKIFQMRLLGMSAEKIAARLNNMHILSPYMYKKSRNSNFKTSFTKSENTKWSPVAVRRILSNETYTGVMVQGKDRKVSYKLPDRVKNSRDKWIRVQNNVDVIIEREIFERVRVGVRSNDSCICQNLGDT